MGTSTGYDDDWLLRSERTADIATHERLLSGATDSDLGPKGGVN